MFLHRPRSAVGTTLLAEGKIAGKTASFLFDLRSWEAAKVDEIAAFMGEWLDIFIPSL